MNAAEQISIATLVIIILVVFIISIFVFSKKQVREEIWHFFKKITKNNDKNLNEKNFYDNLSSSLLKLSADKIGAIIAIEREESLDPFINVGYKVKGDFSPEFIISVFYNKNSALHDGAVIVRGQQIVSISSYFPMTRQLLDVSYGARHRSAVGLSERTDSVVFVVSETNGRISVAQGGRIRRLSQNPDRLVDEIAKVLMQNPKRN